MRCVVEPAVFAVAVAVVELRIGCVAGGELGVRGEKWRDGRRRRAGAGASVAVCVWMSMPETDRREVCEKVRDRNGLFVMGVGVTVGARFGGVVAMIVIDCDDNVNAVAA